MCAFANISPMFACLNLASIYLIGSVQITMLGQFFTTSQSSLVLWCNIIQPDGLWLYVSLDQSFSRDSVTKSRPVWALWFNPIKLMIGSVQTFSVVVSVQSLGFRYLFEILSLLIPLRLFRVVLLKFAIYVCCVLYIGVCSEYILCLLITFLFDQCDFW